MSTKELALDIFENLSQDELEAFVVLFGKGSSKSRKKKSARGVWNSVANPNLISLEEGALERAVAERYSDENENT